MKTSFFCEGVGGGPCCRQESRHGVRAEQKRVGHKKITGKLVEIIQQAAGQTVYSASTIVYISSKNL